MSKIYDEIKTSAQNLIHALGVFTSSFFSAMKTKTPAS